MESVEANGVKRTQRAAAADGGPGLQQLIERAQAAEQEADRQRREARQAAEARLDELRVEMCKLETFVNGGTLPVEEKAEAPARRRGRPAGSARPAKAVAEPKAAKSSNGRLPRRSDEDIAKLLEQVISVVRAAGKDGMRAEQLRVRLGWSAKELPRVLKFGVAEKELRTSGQKRATTYFLK